MADKKVYTEEEKKSILARAEEIGVHAAAKEAGAAWQSVARWKKQLSATAAEVKAEAEKVEADVKAEAEKVAEEAAKVEKKTRGRAKRAAEEAKEAEDAVKSEVKKTRGRAKKAADDVKETAKAAAEKIKEEAKAVEKKTEQKIKAASRGKRMITTVTIQSPLGGEITPDEIRSKVGDVDHIYVRVDQNKAYWVKGEETGSVDLW